MALLAAGLASWQTGHAEYGWWWLTNESPPAIDARGPSGVQRGTIQVSVAAGPTGRAELTAALLDGVPLPPPAAGQPIELDTTRIADGQHVLRLEAEDRSRRRNRATVELTFATDNTPPKVAVSGAPAALRAGFPAAIRLAPDEPADVRLTSGADPLPLIELPGAAGAPQRLLLLGTPPNASAGQLQLRLAARDAAGNTGEETLSIAIEPAQLPRQALLVPATLAPLATGPVATAEAAQLLAITSVVRPVRLWAGEFRSPLAAGLPRTTGFGDRRDYVDGHVAYHAGYDVAAPEGTPVLAAATGVVAFAGSLPQRGNTVVLDHGWGVFSVYAHLAHLQVQAGQSISQGQSVGPVGNTGLSTGPHLHWEVRIRGQAVDPNAWIALSRELP